MSIGPKSPPFLADGGSGRLPTPEMRAPHAQRPAQTTTRPGRAASLPLGRRLSSQKSTDDDTDARPSLPLPTQLSLSSESERAAKSLAWLQQRPRKIVVWWAKRRLSRETAVQCLTGCGQTPPANHRSRPGAKAAGTLP